MSIHLLVDISAHGLGHLAQTAPVIKALLSLPAAWQVHREDVRTFDNTGLDFADMLASVDAIVTKPGYGTFVEAACKGSPILYLRHDDWLETRHLSAWLAKHGRASAISRSRLMSGQFIDEMVQLWRRQPPAPPLATGADEAATVLQTVLRLQV